MPCTFRPLPARRPWARWAVPGTVAPGPEGRRVVRGVPGLCHGANTYGVGKVKVSPPGAPGKRKCVNPMGLVKGPSSGLHDARRARPKTQSAAAGTHKRKCATGLVGPAGAPKRPRKCSGAGR
jgi:hypothetical protein